ncbi:MAG: sigma-70 family RNA polymerase sigma factor, partial [Planctomycetes bacterium]|nr:sigma-70 family RNA polymerase sigma factor [Planctomycetota bacterium]
MTIENSFLRYRETGDPAALGAVFDRLAPDLVLVAAHLAGSDAADDLVQATSLAAIEQRERWDPERPLAPWLVGLLGNHIRRARRLRARVPDPARLAARDVPASDAIAEARDTIAAVHAAVERLPRHYRAVLSLRLVRDLDLQAIANTLGLPLGTVKVRLHRGLELLRRTLPVGLAAVVAGLVASGPGLAAVRRAVLDRAEALPSSAVAAGAITTGIAIGGIYVKQWLFGVAVCALLAVGWFAVPPDGSAVAQAMVPSPPSPPAVATGEDPAAPVEPAGVGSDVPRREAVAPVDAATRPGAIAIVATWGSDGGPAAGVALSLHREGHAPVLAPQVGSAVTDERGQLVFDGLSPGSYRVSALLIGITPGEPIAVEAGRTAAVELALDGAIQLAIRVCDPAGVPCAGAEVYGVEPFQRGEPVRRLGTTTGDGRLFYRGVPLEYVFARRAGRTPSPTHRLPAARTGAASAAPTAVALTVGEPGCVLVGSVVDPEGRAVADARVAIAVVDEFGGEDDPAAIVVHTDAAGRFACDELPPGERNVMARRAGYGPAIARATTCADDTATITLALTAAASLAGSVTDARGAPVGGVNVRVGNGVPVTGIRWSASPMLATSTDAAG